MMVSHVSFILQHHMLVIFLGNKVLDVQQNIQFLNTRTRRLFFTILFTLSGYHCSIWR
jgi:hypothetical protein